MHQKQVIIRYFVFRNILNRITLSSNQINFRRGFVILVLEAVTCNKAYCKGMETKIPLDVFRNSLGEEVLRQ